VKEMVSEAPEGGAASQPTLLSTGRRGSWPLARHMLPEGGSWPTPKHALPDYLGYAAQ
jgi:hypothetical protein